MYMLMARIASGTDYRQIPLNEYDEIAIVYGKLPEYIPSTYEFPEGL